MILMNTSSRQVTRKYSSDCHNVARQLFVYGTLAPGRSNAHVLAPLAGQWRQAWIRGRLYPEGTGLARGYPALLPREDLPWVEGYLFTSPALPDYWDELDCFEGPAYRRRSVTVKCADGSLVVAQVYALNDANEGVCE